MVLEEPIFSTEANRGTPGPHHGATVVGEDSVGAQTICNQYPLESVGLHCKAEKKFQFAAAEMTETPLF